MLRIDFFGLNFIFSMNRGSHSSKGVSVKNCLYIYLFKFENVNSNLKTNYIHVTIHIYSLFFLEEKNRDLSLSFAAFFFSFIQKDTPFFTIHMYIYTLRIKKVWGFGLVCQMGFLLVLYIQFTFLQTTAAFLCFQTSQSTRITTKLNPLRNILATDLLDLHHHSWKRHVEVGCTTATNPDLVFYNSILKKKLKVAITHFIVTCEQAMVNLVVFACLHVRLLPLLYLLPILYDLLKGASIGTIILPYSKDLEQHGVDFFHVCDINLIWRTWIENGNATLVLLIGFF
ncbi:hypothetical protein ACJX0J_031441 [Zea mays]